MNVPISALCLFFFPFFLVTASLEAEVKLPAVIDSHMVLQQGMAVPIWGTAAPDEEVKVSFRDQTKSATADAEGKWMVRLDPLQPGEATTLTVAGSNTLTLKDVVVGEVWVGSGQSNIDSPIPMYEDKDPVLKEAAARSYPDVRVFRSARNLRWQSWDPKRTRIFSAQLFYFGLKLQEELKVPIGLVEAAYAGSPSGNFISAEAFRTDPDIQKVAAEADAKKPLEERMKKYEEALIQFEQQKEASSVAPDPAVPAAPDQPKAKTPKAPVKPVSYGQQKTGAHYETYVRPVIPFAIRGVLWDQGEGGSTVEISQPVLMKGLIRSWRKDWGQGEFPWIYVKKPSGGGCALNPGDPINQGAMPFQQLPKKIPDSDYHTGLHRDFMSIRKNPNTFMVVTTDLATGVHPPNKSGYGARSSRVALGAVYGKPLEYYGPDYDSFKVEGNKLRISFTHTGQGLTVPAGQKLQGFLIAGGDGQFQWAEAEIDGDTVVLSHPGIPNPVAARYAWTWPMAWANLFNKDGLPAFMFRTEE